MTDHIFDRTRVIVERVMGTGRTPSCVGPDTALAAGSGLNSATMLAVVRACEAEFGIVFAEAGDLDGAALATVGSLVHSIRDRLARQQQRL